MQVYVQVLRHNCINSIGIVVHTAGLLSSTDSLTQKRLSFLFSFLKFALAVHAFMHSVMHGDACCRHVGTSDRSDQGCTVTDTFCTLA